MPASPADSALFGQLLGDAETSRLFSDSACIRAMLLVEGALAQVQGALGVIPTDAAAFIHRAAQEVQIDPAALGPETVQNGVPVPALIAAFRKAAGAGDLMQYLHWGVTSQDIMDTSLALRLRPLLDLWDARLSGILRQLAEIAELYADLPMAARTYGQNATPTSFGAVVAGWGWPLLMWRDQFLATRAVVLQVSLSGAAGTLSAMGPNGPLVRAALAQALGLSDPGRSWHSDRSSMAQLVGIMSGLAGSLGKLGEDLLLLTQTGLDEVSLRGGGASSTMPQKQNPVAPSVLVALSRQVIGLSPILQSAGLHRQQRDGAAWFTEWLILPQMCISLGRMLGLTTEILANLSPNPTAMRLRLEDGNGLIHAESLSFFLSEKMARSEAQTLVKTFCIKAASTDRSLASIATERLPGIDLSTVFTDGGLGQAPAEARAFAARARIASSTMP
jgi:3-carboxy-cis,cis-muconate cycloisomerase